MKFQSLPSIFVYVLVFIAINALFVLNEQTGFLMDSEFKLIIGDRFGEHPFWVGLSQQIFEHRLGLFPHDSRANCKQHEEHTLSIFAQRGAERLVKAQGEQLSAGRRAASGALGQEPLAHCRGAVAF